MGLDAVLPSSLTVTIVEKVSNTNYKADGSTTQQFMVTYQYSIPGRGPILTSTTIVDQSTFDQLSVDQTFDLTVTAP